MKRETAAPAAALEGVAAGELEARWGVPLLEVHESLGSTNDRARELAAAGAAPFTTVIAETQTAGRGRRGRPWHSPPGAGLWMTMVLRPHAGEAARRLLPLLLGLAAARGVERAAPGLRIGLKWPNDLQVEGRKLAGILCEAAAGGAVVGGVGVNVRRGAGLPEAVRGSATSVEEAAARPADRAVLAGAIVEEARRLLDAPVLRLEGDVAREVAARDVLRGCRVRLDDGREGTAAGIGAGGALLVRRGGAVEEVVGGGVRPTEASGVDDPGSDGA